MRRADSICRQAIATTRRKQLSRLCEALELMVLVKPRNDEEADAQTLAITDLLRRNTAHSDTPPPV